MKIDLFRTHNDQYRATTKPILVEVTPARYLAVDGVGEPGGSTYQEKVAALYSVAYALKFGAKATGRDYVVAKLEGLYGIDGQPASELLSIPRDQWKWRHLIRQPDFIDRGALEEAQNGLRSKGKEGDFGAVQLVDIDEGPCVQILHIGPYADEQPTIEAMHTFVADQKLSLHGWHHEIYLSDPRRVPPERLRTLLRHQIESAT